MLRKEIILSILLAFFLVISSASAMDNLTEEAISIDNSSDAMISESIDNQSQALLATSKSFSELNSIINDNYELNIIFVH